MSNTEFFLRVALRGLAQALGVAALATISMRVCVVFLSLPFVLACACGVGVCVLVFGPPAAPRAYQTEDEENAQVSPALAQNPLSVADDSRIP